MEIRPRHPFTIRELSLVAFDKSTSRFGRNSTTAWDEESWAARKTRARAGPPRLSSSELVTRYRVRGLSPRYKYISLQRVAQRELSRSEGTEDETGPGEVYGQVCPRESDCGLALAASTVLRKQRSRSKTPIRIQHTDTANDLSKSSDNWTKAEVRWERELGMGCMIGGRSLPRWLCPPFAGCISRNSKLLTPIVEEPKEKPSYRLHILERQSYVLRESMRCPLEIPSCFPATLRARNPPHLQPPCPCPMHGPRGLFADRSPRWGAEGEISGIGGVAIRVL